MQKRVVKVQMEELFKPQMHNFMLSQAFFLDSSEQVKNIPRYSVTVVDHHKQE